MKDAATHSLVLTPALPSRENTPSPNARRSVTRLVILGALLVTTVLACRSSSKPDPSDGLTLSLDAVPLLVKAADSLDVATIWATVLEYGEPVRDSTLVSFVASNGKVESRAWTRDGLAQATFRPGATPGVASVVAQVRAVRDTVLLTVY